MPRFSLVIRSALAACLLSAAVTIALADDYRVESYKRTVAALVEKFGAKIAAIGRDLPMISREIEQLQAKSPRSADDERRLSELKARRETIREQMAQEADNLRVSLLLVDPPTSSQVPEAELVPLPGFVKEIIRDKGLPIGHGIAIRPDVSYNFKAGKLESASIIISGTW